MPSGTQCKEKHCCYYRIFYNDISLLSTGICQWLFIKPRCNICFLQDASVNHKVSKGGSSWGKSWLLLNERRWRGKGERKTSLGEFTFLTCFSSKISTFKAQKNNQSSWREKPNKGSHIHVPFLSILHKATAKVALEWYPYTSSMGAFQMGTKVDIIWFLWSKPSYVINSCSKVSWQKKNYQQSTGWNTCFFMKTIQHHENFVKLSKPTLLIL